MAPRLQLDLNSPVFLDGLLELEGAEFVRIAKALKRLRTMDWPTLLRHRGSRWEEISHLTGPGGRPVHSIRLSQKYRALAQRDGNFLRLLSLHLDHDSAYEG